MLDKDIRYLERVEKKVKKLGFSSFSAFLTVFLHKPFKEISIFLEESPSTFQRFYNRYIREKEKELSSKIGVKNG